MARKDIVPGLKAEFLSLPFRKEIHMNAYKHTLHLPLGIVMLVVTVTLTALVGLGSVVNAQNPVYLQLDGESGYVQVTDRIEDFSVQEGLTVSAWIRPDTLSFTRSSEGSGYVHWLGKGSRGLPGNQQEWTFRMYNEVNAENRPNRISFYVFPPTGGGLGTGSYFQDPVMPGQWIHVVGILDNTDDGYRDAAGNPVLGQKGRRTYIFKNGKLRDCDQYQGAEPAGTTVEQITVLPDDTRRVPCVRDSRTINPAATSAPLRIGTRDAGDSMTTSYFQGAIAEVRIWNRPLSQTEIRDLYASNLVPQDGLVAEYLLNQDTGTIAIDTVGGHDGEIKGAATWAPGCFEGPVRVCP